MNKEEGLVIKIIHNGYEYIPLVQEGVTFESSKKINSNKINFNVIKDSILNFEEGDIVKATYNGVGFFYGYVFSKSRSNDNIIKVTAYDQLRYLKNKDSVIIEEVTLSELVKSIIGKCNLKIENSNIVDTNVIIDSRVERNSSYLDMIEKCLSYTKKQSGKEFYLYDDFGVLTLKDISSMRLNKLIDDSCFTSFDYSSSIDSDVYNEVFVTYKEGKEEKRVSDNDEDSINRIGLLRLVESADSKEEAYGKVETLLNQYSKKKRKLSLKNVFGDIKVRGGCEVFIKLNLGDVEINDYFLVENVTHSFNANEYFMEIILSGGGVF